MWKKAHEAWIDITSFEFFHRTIHAIFMSYYQKEIFMRHFIIVKERKKV